MKRIIRLIAINQIYTLVNSVFHVSLERCVETINLMIFQNQYNNLILARFDAMPSDFFYRLKS